MGFTSEAPGSIADDALLRRIVLAAEDERMAPDVKKLCVDAGMRHWGSQQVEVPAMIKQMAFCQMIAHDVCSSVAFDVCFGSEAFKRLMA